MRSQTGSGKTLAYAVPIIDALQGIQPKLKRTDGIQAIIVVPTRELALQVNELFSKINVSHLLFILFIGNPLYTYFLYCRQDQAQFFCRLTFCSKINLRFIFESDQRALKFISQSIKKQLI